MIKAYNLDNSSLFNSDEDYADDSANPANELSKQELNLSDINHFKETHNIFGSDEGDLEILGKASLESGCNDEFQALLESPDKEII